MQVRDDMVGKRGPGQFRPLDSGSRRELIPQQNGDWKGCPFAQTLASRLSRVLRCRKMANVAIEVTVMPVTPNSVDATKFNNKIELPFELRLPDFQMAI